MIAEIQHEEKEENLRPPYSNGHHLIRTCNGPEGGISVSSADRDVARETVHLQTLCFIYSKLLSLFLLHYDFVVNASSFLQFRLLIIHNILRLHV